MCVAVENVGRLEEKRKEGGRRKGFMGDGRGECE